MFNPKKRLFKKKIKDVQNSIWEFEFKVSKSRQVREGIRQDRDRQLEAAERVAATLKGEEDKAKIEALTKELTIFTENAKRFEQQMQMIDDQIQGIPAKDDNPGQQGINDTLKSLAELREMYKDHIKSL
jgi:predicted  nucleic acid-binding Zn-ribbon protein